jgi:hypothetical protein
MFKRSKITANGIITVMLDIRVATRGITTRIATMTTVKFSVVIITVIDTATTITTAVTASDTVIGSVVTAITTIIIIITTIIIIIAIIISTATTINIATTPSYNSVRLASCTFRDRQGTASK